MNEIENIIDEFRKLNLSTYPEKKIKDLFNRTGNIGAIIVTLHKGKTVMRARPNNGYERFKKKSDFSFKPQDFNKTFQRASTPNKTMFYASLIPEKIEKGELDNMRIIGVSETIPMMRNKKESGFQKISFGRWTVEEDINLIAIVHEQSYYKESNYTRELVDAYNNFSAHQSKELVEKSLKFQNFLASEFSKEIITADYDYMISAIFTENVTKNGLDGVLYPSVRVDGQGFNIAITPEATNRLGLYVAGECSIYKLNDQVVIGNDAIIELDGSQTEFELIDSENDQADCLAILGVKSIDDLIKDR